VMCWVGCHQYCSTPRAPMGHNWSTFSQGSYMISAASSTHTNNSNYSVTETTTQISYRGVSDPPPNDIHDVDKELNALDDVRKHSFNQLLCSECGCLDFSGVKTDGK
jgi:hypothetical protein